MRNKVTGLVIVIVFFSLSSWTLSRAEEVNAKNLFGFAESLFEEEDFFRAIGEYKRFIFLYPRDANVERAHVRIAESFYKAKRWAEAVSACDKFLSRFPQSPLYLEILYLKGKAEKQDRRFDDAMRTFDDIIAAKSKTYSDKALYQKALTVLDTANWKGARNTFLQMPKDSPLYPTAASVAAGLAEHDNLPRKSPIDAGILAAIIPGAGHLYTERPVDALVSFLLNASFILGAVELFRHDNYVAGGILTFFELGWYGGNIYSAVSSAHKYNRDKEEELLRKIKNNFSISFYSDGINCGLVLHKNF